MSHLNLLVESSLELVESLGLVESVALVRVRRRVHDAPESSNERFDLKKERPRIKSEVQVRCQCPKVEELQLKIRYIKQAAASFN